MNTQEFKKRVGQAIQTETVTQNFHKHKQATTIFNLPAPRPESQLQAEFQQRTGIWCPKPAREWLESLMAEYSFTARELSIAWNAGSIGWDAEKDEKRIVTPWIQAAFAYAAVGFVVVYFLLIAYQVFWGPGAQTQWGMVLFFVIGAMYVGTCWMANRFMLWPRRVAQRVRRTCQ